jgi:hypothetical protein
VVQRVSGCKVATGLPEHMKIIPHMLVHTLTYRKDDRQHDRAGGQEGGSGTWKEERVSQAGCSGRPGGMRFSARPLT